MKISHLLLGVSLFGAAVLPLSAAFESAQPLEGNLPPVYPGGLVLEGITRGRALVGASIDETGRVKDVLVLAYTNPRFARVSVEALREWRFSPARVDGVPVPVQTEISFDYTLEGAVISANVMNHFFFDNFPNAGDNALAYRPADVSRLDHTPQRIGGKDPQYALAAAKDGVKGRVSVRFYIDEKGAVRLPAVASGVTNPYLMDQAVAAVKTWKFEPVTSRGKPVLVVAQQDFNFGSDR